MSAARWRRVAHASLLALTWSVAATAQPGLGGFGPGGAVETGQENAAAPASVAARGIPGYHCYRTVRETYSTAQAIANRYPQLATWTAVGESWQKQNGSRRYDLMVLRLTNSATAGEKPVAFITSALHAREYTTAELMTRFAEYLVEAYGTDADTTWLLDHHDVHLMLIANPDGRKHAENGVAWRKNDNTDHCWQNVSPQWPGVDLNRNFDMDWGGGGSSDFECAHTFRGDAAESEPETQAIVQYMQDLFPDARGPDDDDVAALDTSGIYLDIHSAGRLVLHPWSFTTAAPPNAQQLWRLARKLAFFNGYRPDHARGGLGYFASGTAKDYAYGALGRAAFTYELGTAHFESCSRFEERIVPDNFPSLVYALKVARTPYLTPAGPDAFDVQVGGGAASRGVPPGTTVALSATLDDGRFSRVNGAEAVQDIAAGEYYVDVPPWDAAADANALSPSDGSFDGTMEAATASIDTTGWDPGRHIVFVRARDSDHNWGAVTATFLIVNPGPALSSATVSGALLTLVYGDVLDPSSTPAPTDFKVTAGGSLREVSDVAMDGSTLTLTLAASVAAGEEVTVSYTPGTSPLRSAAGRDAADLIRVAATTVEVNRPPVPAGTLPALSLRVADGAVSVDVSGAFEDPEDDGLTYEASSSNESVATVSASGSTVSVTPVATGTATVTVTATDVDGSNTTATQTLRVTVAANGSPEAVGRLPALSLRVVDGARTVDVSGAFRDRDGDDLTYGASSSNERVATVSASGSMVALTPVSRGTATVTVTATDVDGSNTRATQRFDATVANRTPVPVGRLPALSLRAGGVRSLDVSGAFEDPDDDPLTFDASSSDALVATASARGSAVRVSAVWPGTVVVTVAAEDPDGLRAEQAFELTVPNRPPVPVGTLPALSLASGGDEAAVDVSGAFADPEDDPLTFAASSSEATVAAADASGPTVVVTPASEGTATVTVTATDEGGSHTSATQRFGVGVDRSAPSIDGGGRVNGGGGGGGGRSRVPNRPPAAVGELADRSLTLGAGPAVVDVTRAFEDPDRDELTYAAVASAADVVAVALAGSVVTLTPVGAGTAVVTVTATDGEESHEPATHAFTVTVVVDYDADADGLIEVRTLAQLDALRHDLDGDGVPAAAGEAAHAAAFEGAIGGLSCPDGCRGYELAADLDFDTNGSGGPDAGDAYWNNGSGWSPIGTAAEPFAAAFEGNGRVIRRLFVVGGEGAGLFGATARSGVVAGVGLIEADVTGTQAAGALAGRNGGLVTGCWATGRVSATAAAGGLAGSNAGDIRGSYAAVAVSGERQAGGLVGANDGGLAAVYATGRVSGTEAVGGLVGHQRGTLTAAYATGRVRGSDEAGGLVGAASGPATAEAGYWDTETSGLESSAAGRGLTTSTLQGATAYRGLYAAWNVDADGDGAVDAPWHFGARTQYPALSLDVDGDGAASWQELGRQLRAGPALTATAAAVPTEAVLTWTAADTSAWTPPPEVAYTVTREAGAALEVVAAGVRGARYVDADVQPGVAYTYQVAAVVEGGEAARSALVAARLPCAYAVTPPHRDVLWTAGAGELAVTTAPGCAWTAASESGFLAVTAGAAGAGPGTVRYTAAANAGGPRQGALAVAGRRVAVYQASPTEFTDHPIERGVTPVRAIHFLELRARIDALRTAAGGAAFGWTDPLLTPGVTPIRRVHLTELRAALAEAYSAAGRAAPTYMDPVTAGATAIRAAHLMELRAAVAALE